MRVAGARQSDDRGDVAEARAVRDIAAAMCRRCVLRSAGLPAPRGRGRCGRGPPPPAGPRGAGVGSRSTPLGGHLPRWQASACGVRFRRWLIWVVSSLWAWRCWGDAMSAESWAALVTGVVAGLAALLGFLGNQLANRRERKSKIYAEALEAVQQYTELPFIIRRRPSSDGATRAALA